ALIPSASSLRLLVDECSEKESLLSILRLAGHDVLTVSDVGLRNRDDAVVLERARTEQRVLLTRNDAHFRGLHELDPNHPGILVVRFERDSSKRMADSDIVR